MEYATKNDSEKWARKNVFEIPPCEKPFSENIFYFIERRIFPQNCKFRNKNLHLHGGISIKKFVMYLHMINETLSHKFYPYTILSM